MNSLEVRGLVHTFPGRPPVSALADVSLDIPSGGITAILGPSGCGKTTLLRALAGLVRPQAGTIDLVGRRIEGPGVHLPPERRRIGLVPQEGALFPHLDVAGNIAFGLRGQPRTARRARVGELLDLIGLPGLGARRPSELSGGQQQRVALARALAPHPDVVLLDEPFSALDTSLRASLRDEVAATLRAAGTTGVLVTHDQTEALSTASHLAVMREGRIVQVGAPIDVYQRPVDLWTGRFLGDAVVLQGRLASAGAALVDTDLGRLERRDDTTSGTGTGTGTSGASPGRAVTVFCRPEQLGPAAPGTGGTRATVTSVRFLGTGVAIGLQVGETQLRALWPAAAMPAVGDEVHVSITGPVLTFAP